MNSLEAFIDAACVSFGSGVKENQDLTPKRIQVAWDSAHESIQLASVLGHVAALNTALQSDSAAATRKGGPRQWDPLTYLCFSHFLRQPLKQSDVVASAELLLEAGADPNSGFPHPQHSPEPMFESVLYGAAGIAHHEALTRLLLKYGADPNDGETPYHVPEGYDNGAFQAVFESGKLNESGVATLLLRKIDFHDGPAISWLLEQGVAPNIKGHWGKTALQSAIVRGNDLSIIRSLLQHGADTESPGKDGSARTLAARYGRGDVLRTFNATDRAHALKATDQLIAACATGNETELRSLTEQHPDAVIDLQTQAGFLLAEFAGSGNTTGIGLLLSVGCEVNSRHGHGDIYFDITQDSTPLHAAAWRAQHETVSFLIESGADVSLTDGKGRSALHLAVEASVNSYWTEKRSPQSVAALIEAGATRKGVRFPCGYEKIDTLLASIV